MVEEREPGPRGHLVEDRRDDGVLVPDRERDMGHNDGRTAPLGHEVQRVPAGVVLVVGGDQLVAGAEESSERRTVLTA